MIKIETAISGAYIIKPVAYTDERGEFYTSFSREVYTELGILHFNIAQMNHSVSKKHVLRGLHYQAGLHAQAKLVWVNSGSVLDVFVDLRTESPTYGSWASVTLTPNGNCLFVPKGCAHGFLSLEDDTTLNYLCSNPYNKESERCLIWNDQQLDIPWPIVEEPILSYKDKLGLSFEACEKFVVPT